MNNFVSKLLDKVIDKTGVLSALFALFVFGGLSVFLEAGKVLPMTISAFTLSGFLEVFHQKRNAELETRCQPIYNNGDIFWAFMSKKPKVFWPREIEEFTYEGMRFKVMGVKDVPGPLIIMGPHCPRCQGDVREAIIVKFPGIIKIRFHCICGYSQKSLKTKAEIIDELYELKGLPVDDGTERGKHKKLSP